MKDTTCMYCMKNDAQKAIMTYICDLEATELYLFNNQACKGRCIVAFKDHVNELHDLTEEQTAAFARDMRKVGLAISKAFAPKKINYGMYNDNGTHLHCHIVPKYVGGVDFGTTFAMNPDPAVTLSDEEMKAVIDAIKANL
ncbi:MAG: HIT family protein [Clostridiales bacterium]|nr:HIT family protein [Clostridiales bacterium]MBQ2816722.1 HIT family protein [Clostridia bacterium]